MSAVPNIKSHFASSGVTTPGFAVPSAVTAAAQCASSPIIAPSPLTANFFTNVSSSYQSHFGVVGGAVSPSMYGSPAGAKSPHALPASPVSLAKISHNNSRAPTPIGGTAAGSEGGPCSASVPINGHRSTTPSSHGNSPHTLSVTTSMKFASPMALGTSPKSRTSMTTTTTTLEATAAAGNSFSEGSGVTTAAEARKSSLDAAPVSIAVGAPLTTTNNNSSMNLTASGAASASKKSTASQADMDKEVLSGAHKYATVALSAGGGGSGGAALSPTSPAAPHSGTLSPTDTTPRVELMAPSSSAGQLSAAQQQQQQQQHNVAFSSAAPLTPLSAQSSSSRHSNPCSREPVVDVYDSDFKTLLSIPVSQVVHRPHPSLGVSRLVLCRNYSHENPGNCTKGELCKFVHADITNASRCSIHVNYAWRSLDLCAYPRLPPGDELTVLAPNERQPSEVIPSERILVTRGSTNWREHTAPLSHCAHYYFNRMCNRGECCNFIHAVHVDPNVQGDFKRAPAPTAVAPIVSKSSTSPGLRGKAGDGGVNAASGRGTNAGTAQPPPPPPLPPQQPCSAFGYAPNGYVPTQPPPPPPLPPGPMGYSISSSPTAGGGSYVMFSSSGAPTGFVPATLVPPPPSHLGNSNGVYLLVPAHPGMSSTGSATPASPVSPLGQSLGSLSNGPIDWSFYGDLETSAWMPPSPSSRI